MQYDFEDGLLIFSGFLNLILIVIVCGMAVERRRIADHVRDLSGTLSRSTADLNQAIKENSSDVNKRT